MGTLQRAAAVGSAGLILAVALACTQGGGVQQGAVAQQGVAAQQGGMKPGAMAQAAADLKRPTDTVADAGAVADTPAAQGAAGQTRDARREFTATLSHNEAVLSPLRLYTATLDSEEDRALYLVGEGCSRSALQQLDRVVGREARRLGFRAFECARSTGLTGEQGTAFLPLH